MTTGIDKITDAYILLRVHSADLTVEELINIAGINPADIGRKGSAKPEKTVFKAKNHIALNTETLVAEKDLNSHIQHLGQLLSPGNFAARFDGLDTEIYLTVYWWTTEEVNFHLTSESLQVLAAIGVTAHFNLMIDPGSIGE